jgi:hypothetical protein
MRVRSCVLIFHISPYNSQDSRPKPKALATNGLPTGNPDEP